MALVRHDPWSFMSQLQEDLNRTLNTRSPAESSAATAEWVPAVDVEEYNDRFQLFVDLPGVPADQVDITLDAGVLTLSGERSVQRTEEEVVRRRSERGHGRFYRRFLLPETANADGVEARERNGVLEITIPKQAAAQPRRIKIAA